jgi:glycosyltransferase involved in cell wall biosynthesis
MSRLPRVDVLMPSYNHEDYVAAAVESVLFQSYPNVRLVAVDDCSGDRTGEILEEYAERFPDRVVFVRNPANLGIPAVWNACLSHVDGEFVQPFASDDILPPGAVEAKVRFMLERPEVDVLVTDFFAAGPDGTVLGGEEKLRLVPQFARMYTADWDRVYEELLQGNFICGGAVLVRLGRVQKGDLVQDPMCPNLSDYDMWLRLARGFRWAYVPQRTYVYRWHGENRSSPDNPLNTEEVVHGQMAYILSKHLVLDQTDLQRELTIAVLNRLTVSLFRRLKERREAGTGSGG